jgi:enolase
VVRIRTILNSAGGLAAEVDVVFSDRFAGRASTAVARKPGCREKARSSLCCLGPVAAAEAAGISNFLIYRRFSTQAEFDADLAERMYRQGADVCLARLGHSRHASIGIDAAGEHLKGTGKYQFGSEVLDSYSPIKKYAKLRRAYPISYLKDPFEFSDGKAWSQLRLLLKADVTIVGDDVFATDCRYIDATLANAILLKMNQIGTLSGTLQAASKAPSQGMSLCVSHRSYETEDTALCDLAVSLGAEYVKIGGPRRSDRTAKYNQLLRLEETIARSEIRPQPSCRPAHDNFEPP